MEALARAAAAVSGGAARGLGAPFGWSEASEFQDIFDVGCFIASLRGELNAERVDSILPSVQFISNVGGSAPRMVILASDNQGIRLHCDGYVTQQEMSALLGPGFVMRGALLVFLVSLRRQADQSFDAISTHFETTLIGVIDTFGKDDDISSTLCMHE
ncbi:hypothetical protein TRIUR3_21920 [Triticum urartu]|uniref:Uncharacterized protein n=1 Tax=Triticum urartu TaxID=4572 RepID=M7ZW19_TRIUA|nr:hypothetical protein TRIUR3_21920 [Triticum urartu]